MFSYVLMARRGLWLFHDWEEARSLWDRLDAVAAGEPLCLLPDRALLLAGRPLEAQLRAAMSGHSRHLAHRWCWPGLQLWRPLEPPTRLRDPRQRTRTRAQIEGAAQRGALVEHPLAWPFTTLRDRRGLAWPTHGAPSPAPPGQRPIPEPSPEALRAAVGGVTRTPAALLLGPGPPRRGLLGCERALTSRSMRGIARELGVSHSVVARCPAPDPALLIAVRRALCEPHVGPLPRGDLRRSEAWARYRQRRAQWEDAGSGAPPARYMPASSNTSE